MALSLSFSSTSVSKTADEITLKDATGAYNVSTNPGGYGVANDFIAPTVAFFIWRFWTATSSNQKFVKAAQATLLQSSDGYTVTPEYIGIGGADDVFSDGVHQVQYVPLNDSGVSAVFTNGSKIVTFTGWDPTAIAQALVTFVAGLAIGDSDTNHSDALEVDWTATNNTTQVTLKSAFDGTTGTYRLWFGAVADLKILVNKAADACIASAVGQLATMDCECSNEEKMINKMIRWKFGADIQFSCDDFDGAHNLIQWIGKYCTDNCSICNRR